MFINKELNSSPTPSNSLLLTPPLIKLKSYLFIRNLIPFLFNFKSNSIGSLLGATEGAAVSMADGTAVGVTVGLADGTAFGAADGTRVTQGATLIIAQCVT